MQYKNTAIYANNTSGPHNKTGICYCTSLQQQRQQQRRSNYEEEELKHVLAVTFNLHERGRKRERDGRICTCNH